MLNIERIKQELKYGDIRRIAEMTGCSEGFVSKVFNGSRNEKSKKGQEIIRVARVIILQRRQLKNLFK